MADQDKKEKSSKNPLEDCQCSLSQRIDSAAGFSQEGFSWKPSCVVFPDFALLSSRQDNLDAVALQGSPLKLSGRIVPDYLFKIDKKPWDG